MDEIRSGEWTAGSIFKNSRDSLANVPSRKGIIQSRPSDLIWTAENTSNGEREGWQAGRTTRRRHGRRRAALVDFDLQTTIERSKGTGS